MNVRVRIGQVNSRWHGSGLGAAVLARARARARGTACGGGVPIRARSGEAAPFEMTASLSARA